MSRLDSGARRLDLRVENAELARRKAQWSPPAKPARGYTRLYVEHVTQAGLGCDLDFLAGSS
jgi:dihydroxy-acid dehydratase